MVVILPNNGIRITNYLQRKFETKRIIRRDSLNGRLGAKFQ
jgi:hypothetical protein